MIRLAPQSSPFSSNLGIALLWLPPERRGDAMVFYRFCRAVDDLADDPHTSGDLKRERLLEWRSALETGTGLPPELAEVFSRHQIVPKWTTALVDGCLRDVSPEPFADMAGLLDYCWQVAVAVGLCSARIFGCSSPLTPDFAENLGRALQLTNILRDVKSDAKIGRVYLPLDLMERHGFCPKCLLRGAGEPDGLRAAAAEIAAEARKYFDAAKAPREDLRPLRPAIAMRILYSKILEHIEKSGFDVWSHRARLSPPSKLFGLLEAVSASE